MEERIYVASKVYYADLWKRYREQGYPIISSWLDEAGEGQSPSLEDLWIRCITEVRSATRLIIYSQPGDRSLKGALIELGAALAMGIPVYAIGPLDELKTAGHHPLIKRVSSFEEALGQKHPKKAIDFKIGMYFQCNQGYWRVTDVGSRTIAAIKMDRADKSWYNGPPYAVNETVFDEAEIPGLRFATEQEANGN